MGRKRAERYCTKGMCFILLAVIAIWHRVPLAQAVSEAEKSFLALYFTAEELSVVSATRSLQSIARIAENITVVTADDIELMNAHTLADVLDSVSGVQVNFSGHFGGYANAQIQGSAVEQVTVLLDGIPLNDLPNNFASLGFIPVQEIEKVEIIKGPASSAWGSALGGVVNVITKGPGSRPYQGRASFSRGTAASGEYRAEISGRQGRFGYYLSGTGLRTDGLTEGFDVQADHLGAKLDFALTERADLRFALFYTEGSRGDGVSKPDDLSFRDHSRQLTSSLALSSALGREGRIDLAVWTNQQEWRDTMEQLSDGLELYKSTNDGRRSGAGLKYSWSHERQDLVVGADYSTGKLDSSNIPGADPELTQWALFANDTLRLGELTIIPGIRYDDISTTDSFVSPSLGLTYALFHNTLVRATVARGFMAPSPAATSATSEITLYQANPELGVEKVWSYQAGFETNVFDALWLKVSAFRHDITDVIESIPVSDPPDYQTNVNQGRQRNEGVAFELKTRPFQHFSLAAAAVFIKARDLETDEDALYATKRQYDVRLTYDDKKSFRGLLKGRYWQEATPPWFNTDLDDMIFDLSLIKKFAVSSSVSPAVYLTVHNLFDGDQYWADIYKNPDRWVEGGVSVAF